MKGSEAPYREKNLVVDVDEAKYARIPITTHSITSRDTIPDVFRQYDISSEKTDIVFVSEKAIASTLEKAPAGIPLIQRLIRFFCRLGPSGSGHFTRRTPQAHYSDRHASALASQINRPVVIYDTDTRGIEIRGVSEPSLEKELISKILHDNPLGQNCPQMPFGIIRRVG